MQIMSTGEVIPAIVGMGVGIVLMVAAVVGTSVRGALSSGDGRPPTIFERIMFFLIGFVFSIAALDRLLQ